MLEGRLVCATEAYLAEVDSLDDYKRNRASIEYQQQELSEKINRLTSQKHTIDESVLATKILSLFDVLNSNCAIINKLRAIRRVIDRIVFDRPNPLIEMFYRILSNSTPEAQRRPGWRTRGGPTLFEPAFHNGHARGKGFTE